MGKMTLYEALKGRFALCDTCGECPHHNRDCYTQNVNLHDICELVNAPGMKPKRGRWVTYPQYLLYDGTYGEDKIVCSECGSEWNILDNDTDTFDYCPHCGAKMEGEKDE